MLASEIIDQARELDPSFTNERHPRKVAINFLSRLQRRLVAEWARLEETSGYVEVFTATFPLADFESGIALETGESVPEPLAITAFHNPLDIYLEGRLEEPDDIQLIAWADRNRRRRIRAAYVRENTLFFTGIEELWNDVVRVELTYTPTPADIAALDEELVLPITAEDALVSHLGAFFARRSKDTELARARREYMLEAQDAEALWLNEIRLREGAEISRTRVVY